MNYYQMLGIRKRSSRNEIRRAYRDLARLIHPDKFQNDERRRQAELQMQHLNEILYILTTPEEKQKYDEALSAHEFENPPETPGQLNLALESYETVFVTRLRSASMHWFSIYSMIVIVAAAAWYWAFSGTQSLPSVVVETAPYEPPPNAKQAAKTGKMKSLRPSPKQIASTPFITAPLENIHAAVELPSASALEISIPVALPADVPTVLPTKALGGPPKLSGLWLFDPSKANTGPENVYAPEYVELRLYYVKETVEGEYSARYRITDRPISPEVTFRLKSKKSTKGVDLNFVWSSADGAEGEAVLKTLIPNTLEMKWWTTKFGLTGKLASGYAQLVRQNSR